MVVHLQDFEDVEQLASVAQTVLTGFESLISKLSGREFRKLEAQRQDLLDDLLEACEMILDGMQDREISFEYSVVWYLLDAVRKQRHNDTAILRVILDTLLLEQLKLLIERLGAHLELMKQSWEDQLSDPAVDYAIVDAVNYFREGTVSLLAVDYADVPTLSVIQQRFHDQDVKVLIIEVNTQFDENRPQVETMDGLNNVLKALSSVSFDYILMGKHMNDYVQQTRDAGILDKLHPFLTQRGQLIVTHIKHFLPTSMFEGQW